MQKTCRPCEQFGLQGLAGAGLRPEPDGCGKLLAVSRTYAAIGPANARVRIISAREAARNERWQYEDKPR